MSSASTTATGTTTTAAATPSSTNPTRFSSTPRAQSVALALGSTIERSKRPGLSQEERRKLYVTATADMSPKFKLFDDSLDIKSESFLETNHDFYILLQSLRKRLKAFCMDDVFQIITMFDPNGVPDDSDPSSVINLIEDYLNVKEDQILSSNYGYRFYGDETALENLNWTTDLLLNSCDEALHDIVANKIFATKEEYHGGPLVLFHIIQATVKTNDSTSRAIIRKLESFKLNKIANEDIDKANAFMRSAIIRLRAADRLPPDVHTMIHDVYLSCSVFAFRDHFSTLKTVRSATITDWEALLKEGETIYRELEFDGRWTPRTKRGSSFNASKGTKPNSNSQQGKETAVHTTDKAGRVIDRVPPKSGEASTRTKDGKTENWCGHPKCNRWGNHLTEDHSTWYNNMKAKWKKFKNNKKDSTKANQSNTNETAASGEPKRLRFAQTATSTPPANF